MVAASTLVSAAKTPASLEVRVAVYTMATLLSPLSVTVGSDQVTANEPRLALLLATSALPQTALTTSSPVRSGSWVTNTGLVTSVTVTVKSLETPVFATAASSVTEAVTVVTPIGNVDPEVTVSDPPTLPMSAA